MTRAEKLAQIAESEQKVYDKGYEEGFKKGKENTDTNVIENVEISLDFSNGDQTERLPDGYSANSVTIFKPENLVPENIAKDVNIAGIIGTHEGGGSIEGVATVTFCNYDGTELYSRPVFIGDDCPEPVAQGKINTPTKESDVQYNYTFNGWSDTLGGSASSTALKNITADKTVYAGYKTSLVYYTVRFYDGDTLMQESQVAYGETATPPSTERDGYEFVGWIPSSLVIKADTDFYGEWETLTEPYIIYEYDNSGNPTSAAFMLYRTLPQNVLGIDTYVKNTTITTLDFSGSPDLKTIEEKAIRGLSGVTHIVIPDSVTTLKPQIFYDCDNLTSITIGKNVSAIEGGLTSGSGKLTTISVADGNESYKVIDNVLYSKDGTTLVHYAIGKSGDAYTIIDGTTNILPYAFYGTKNLRTITVPNSVTEIGDRAFNNAYWVTNFILPDTLTSIGYRAFASCGKMTSIILPDTLTNIGSRAFEQCNSLASLTIPQNVTHIGAYLFANAGSKLTSVTFADTNGWYVATTEGATSGTNLTSADLANTSTAATYLKKTYKNYYWYNT